MSKRLKKNMDVVILCGGKGTRFRKVRNDIPKILAPIKGKPFIEILIHKLKKQNLNRIILATGYLSRKIEQHISKNNIGKVFISEEKYTLGTGGALKNTESYLKSDPVLVINGDTLVEFNSELIIDKYNRNDSDAIILLCKSEFKNQSGSVVLNESGFLKYFSEKKPANCKTDLINAGVYLISRKLIEEINEKINISLEYELIPKWLKENKKIDSFIIKKEIIDFGNEENYRKIK